MRKQPAADSGDAVKGGVAAENQNRNAIRMPLTASVRRLLGRSGAN